MDRFWFWSFHDIYIVSFILKRKKKKGFTKAAENVVEVIEIIIAFFQHCFVAIGDVDQSV